MNQLWPYVVAALLLAALTWLFWFLHQRSIAAVRREAEEELANAKADLELRDAQRTGELLESRRFAQRITDVMPNILYVHDIQRNCNVFINRGMFASLGHDPDFVAKWGPEAVARLMHPDDLPGFTQHMQTLASLGDGAVATATYRMRTADGSWRWFYSRDAVFARNPDGAVREIIGAATDITAIRTAEDVVRENNQRLEFVLHAASMGIWELNHETGVITWSEELARMFGLAPEDAPRTVPQFIELVHPDDRAAERTAVERALATGGLYRIEFRQSLPPGQLRWIAAAGKFTRDAVGRPLRILGLAWDITERKRAEEERDRLEAQLRQSQKMEALGTFAGGIAHDFNNVLTAIRGNATLALADLPTDHPAHVSLEEIQRGAARATDLVRRILAFSRKDESAVLRSTDLRAVVAEAAQLLRATIPSMIDIRVEYDAETPAVMADATQIHQVIMNLGANARDAMSDGGGVLTIALRWTRGHAQLSRFAPELRARGCVRLSVKDTGRGMEPTVLERIFEPFFTTKPAGEGTGMGLAVVHGIVRRHRGFILASSRLGEGTTFDIYLPIAKFEPETAATPGEAAAPRGHGERIFYVDDEEALVSLASRMLTRMGFEVDGKTDAAEALRTFSADPNRYDLVITDLGMPRMSGLEFTAELLRIRPDLPVIITSGYVRSEDAERARAIGARDIVMKPNTVEEMSQLIGRLIARLHTEAATRAPPGS